MFVHGTLILIYTTLYSIQNVLVYVKLKSENYKGYFLGTKNEQQLYSIY